MCNSSKYFCAWCETTSDHRHEVGPPRTRKSISDYTNAWMLEKGGDKKYAIKYKNCAHEPLLHFDENETIVSCIPPPELHIMTGIVTHLFSKLEQSYPDVADTWLKQSQLKFFHGHKQFNGNTARQLLKQHSVLENIAPG